MAFGERCRCCCLPADPLRTGVSGRSDTVSYFFARQTAGRYLKSSGSLKAQVFHHEQKGKDALPSKVAFLFQCPYLVNCSELAVWDHREPEKGSRSPWKPQKKRQICPRHRHSSHGLQRCAPSCANAAAGVLLNSKSIWGTVSAHWIPVLQLNEMEAKRSRHRAELMDFTVLFLPPPTRHPLANRQKYGEATHEALRFSSQWPWEHAGWGVRRVPFSSGAAPVRPSYFGKFEAFLSK